MMVEVQHTGMPVVVDTIDDDFVLALARESETQVRVAERRRLRLATVWAERHAVAEVADAAHWSDVDPRDVDETIGGAGTPLVGAACVEELATAMATSSRAVLRLMSDGLDLKHRLPRTHAAVEALEVAPWRARRIAERTRDLSVEAAAYVDAALVRVADSCGVARIDRLVAEARVEFDIAAQAEAEQTAEASWGVRLDHFSGPTWTGTSRLEVIGDTATLTRFHALVSATAHELLDSTQPVEDQPDLAHRKVAALGVIADGGGATSRTTAYLHLREGDEIGAVERLGSITLDRIRAWLGTSRFTLQPVLDLSRADAVDRHDPPAWMRELVVLRDPVCVHPRCDRSGSRLRRRPHRGLRRDRRRWSARPDVTSQSRAAVPTASPGQDPPRLALQPRAGRQRTSGPAPAGTPSPATRGGSARPDHGAGKVARTRRPVEPPGEHGARGDRPGVPAARQVPAGQVERDAHGLGVAVPGRGAGDRQAADQPDAVQP